MSRRLGILFLALPVWMTIGIVLAAIGAPILRTTAADAAAVVVVLEFSVIGALYLNSAARLKRQGVPAEDPKFRPTIRLKS